MSAFLDAEPYYITRSLRISSHSSKVYIRGGGGGGVKVYSFESFLFLFDEQ